MTQSGITDSQQLDPVSFNYLFKRGIGGGVYRLNLVSGLPKQWINSLTLSTSSNGYGIKEAPAYCSGPRMKGDERFPNMRSAASVLKLIKHIAILLLLALRTDVSTNLSPEFTLEGL